MQMEQLHGRGQQCPFYIGRSEIMLPKQDRTRVRTPTDIEQKYNLGKVLENYEECHNHVDKEDIHVTSEEKTEWNGLVERIKALENKTDEKGATVVTLFSSTAGTTSGTLKDSASNYAVIYVSYTFDDADTSTNLNRTITVLSPSSHTFDSICTNSYDAENNDLCHYNSTVYVKVSGKSFTIGVDVERLDLYNEVLDYTGNKTVKVTKIVGLKA